MSFEILRAPKDVNEMKKVTVYLMGGLGNQLFQYHVGLTLCKSQHRKLILIDCSRHASYNRKNEEGIRALDVSVSGRIMMNSLREFLLRRIINSLKYSWSRNCFSKVGFVFSSDKQHFNQISSKKRNIRLAGYFQNFSLVKDMIGSNIEIKSPTKWYLEMRQLLKAENPIALHIRRGDYLHHAKTIGVLDLKYFEECLKGILENQRSERSVWIFTDSNSAALEFREKILSFNVKVRVVNPPEISQSAESLLLMSLCNEIVISNSTYSWWAAVLGSPDKRVIRPSHWFRNLAEPEDLFPENWIVQDSIWLE
jgi:hypothetical protein